MTDEHTQLTKELLAHDRRGRDPAAAPDAWLATLLEREEVMERRVRRTAIGAWSAAVALVVLLGISIFSIRVVADGWTRDAVRGATLVVGILGILAIFLAVVTTLAWLVRSRAGSLAAIERRLAALEELLARGAPR